MSSRRSRRKAPALARVGKERDRRQDSQSSKREKTDAAPKVAEPINPKLRLGVGVALLVSFLWAYFPTFALLQREWERLPDYSHGYLVIPFALVLGWLRKESMPSFSAGFSIFGLGVQQLDRSLGHRCHMVFVRNPVSVVGFTFAPFSRIHGPFAFPVFRRA